MLLKGQVLSFFEHHLKKRMDAENAELPDNMILDLVMCNVGLEYIPKGEIRVQKYDMSRDLNLGQNMSLLTFAGGLHELNRYLIYFPEKKPRQLDQDEIIEILDQAKAPEWHTDMVAANIDTFSITYVNMWHTLSNWKIARKSREPTNLHLLYQ